MQQEQEHLERSIGRLEGKLDSVVTMVAGLKDSFETMEKGRLSRLEVSFATLKTEVEIRVKNTAMVSAAVTSMVVTVVAGLILYFTTR